MPVRALLTVIILLCQFGLFAQGQVQSAKRVKCGPFTTATLGTEKELYVAGAHGNILKYSREGILESQTSMASHGEITQMQAQGSNKIFFFFKDQQGYLFLDRFLNPSPYYPLGVSVRNYITAVAAADDMSLWMADETNRQLIQFDPTRQKIILEIPYQDFSAIPTLDIIQAEVYQNRLYLNTESDGIYVLDMYGNFMKQIPEYTPTMNFHKQALYYVEYDELHYINLYTDQKTSTPLPKKDEYDRALIGDIYIYLFGEDFFDIYSWP